MFFDFSRIEKLNEKINILEIENKKLYDKSSELELKLKNKEQAIKQNDKNNELKFKKQNTILINKNNELNKLRLEIKNKEQATNSIKNKSLEININNNNLEIELTSKYNYIKELEEELRKNKIVGAQKDILIKKDKMETKNLKNEIIKKDEMIKKYYNERLDFIDKIKEFNKENNRLNDLLEEDDYKALDTKEYIISLEVTKNSIEKKIIDMNNELMKLENDIKSLKEEIIELNDEELYQNFNLYKSNYEIENSEECKQRLTNIRDKQKEMVKYGEATNNTSYWGIEVNTNKKQSEINSDINQLLRCYNSECENLINRAKFNNYYVIKNKIKKSYDTLNRINTKNGIEINEEYLDLKYEELNLVYEYRLKKQQEKEEAKRIREEKREELKLQKEIEEKRIELEKEKLHYDNAMKSLEIQIENEKSEERLKYLINKKKEIESNIVDVDKAIIDIDYRQANYKAGYVYIISNIGAFGENIYKIGMTRRLEPMERIDELSNASVPFKFDVHAMIFSEDAPRLESSIHKALEDKKVNMINGRKEFFKVTLEEIEKVIKENYDKTVEFIKIPEAQQYRETLKNII